MVIDRIIETLEPENAFGPRPVRRNDLLDFPRKLGMFQPMNGIFTTDQSLSMSFICSPNFILLRREFSLMIWRISITSTLYPLRLNRRAKWFGR